MRNSAQRTSPAEAERGRVLGRGLRAQRGVHLTLRTVREAAHKTQAEVAATAEMDQADVSRLERRETFDDCQIATLRRYVEALGGKFEIVAVFGEKKIGIVATSTDPTARAGQQAPAPDEGRAIPGRGRSRT